jgi:hypothetical protein
MDLNKEELILILDIIEYLMDDYPNAPKSWMNTDSHELHLKIHLEAHGTLDGYTGFVFE